MAEELEKKLVELQMLREQLEQYEKHAIALMESGAELQVTKNAVEQLKKLKDGTETMVPLGNGVYVTATLGSLKTFTMGVGSNVFVEKSPKDALKLIDERIEKVEKGTSEISLQIQLLSSAMQKLNMDVEKLAKKK